MQNYLEILHFECYNYSIMSLFPRNISPILIKKLEQERIITVTGARQTGKTTLCDSIVPQFSHLPHTYISFDDPDERLRFSQAPVMLLEKISTPLVILDEVQKAPFIFDPLKHVVDNVARKKQIRPPVFLVTGSSQLRLMPKIKETLAGRVSLLEVWPFSLSEMNGTGGIPVSLTELWEKPSRETMENFKEYSLAVTPDAKRKKVSTRDEHQKWGGYPSVILRKEETEKISWLKDYRKTYTERDVSDAGDIRNIDDFALAQKILASRAAQILSYSEVARELGISLNTVKRYVTLLGITFQTVTVHPYHGNIGKRYVKSPKLFFSDVGLLKATLGNPALESGNIYENWVFTELMKWKQLQPIEPELFFYRTASGTEIDFILSAGDKLLPIEVKSSRRADYSDGKSIENFMNEEKNAPAGIVIYRGDEIVQIRKNIWAIPDWLIFNPGDR
ncbi:MAG: hypothetical protein A2293_05585 [Elusimicrobia bacterium RIFOXYB2_FULL_49_7]|nr:MAG: hypothetical protein A2293_05585 [Elusimicrobia bacterium RIFOXYB2_FULL_49_7]